MSLAKAARSSQCDKYMQEGRASAFTKRVMSRKERQRSVQSQASSWNILEGKQNTQYLFSYFGTLDLFIKQMLPECGLHAQLVFGALIPTVNTAGVHCGFFFKKTVQVIEPRAFPVLGR